MIPRWAAVIVAAGDSTRMGTPKALLPWADTTLLEYAVREARAAGAAEVVVVLGPATRDVAERLADVTVTFNHVPETGRSASICLGSAALQVEPTAVLIQSVDQPAAREVLGCLFAAVADGAVAVPTFGGRRGHPVCFAGRLLPELRGLREEEAGLRSVVRRHADELVEVPVSSESVVWNLNDPAGYAAARAAAATAP